MAVRAAAEVLVVVAAAAEARDPGRGDRPSPVLSPPVASPSKRKSPIMRARASEPAPNFSVCLSAYEFLELRGLVFIFRHCDFRTALSLLPEFARI